jgi:bifunctional DNase/RNase
MEGFEKMVVYGVSFDVVNKQPIVLLKVEEGTKYLPIWIGQSEAGAILMKLQNTELPRPMTHDLMTNVLHDLSARLERVLVTELKDNTFYAVLQLTTDGRQIEVDSRPSDAIALAVRSEAPIFAARALLEANGIEFDQEAETDAEGVAAEAEEDILEKFREFLDGISPQDFSG